MSTLDLRHQVIEKFPNTIYVENVRSLLNITQTQAKNLLQEGVNSGDFEERIGYICPNQGCFDRIIASFEVHESTPGTINCSMCEAEDNEKSVYNTTDLKGITFYKVINNSEKF